MFQWCFPFSCTTKIHHCKNHGVLNKIANPECSGCINVGSCRSAAATCKRSQVLCTSEKRRGEPQLSIGKRWCSATTLAAGPTEWLKFFKTFAVFLGFRFFVADESCSVGQASFLHRSTVDASEIWVVSVGEQVLLSRWPCRLVRAFSIETKPALVGPLSWACVRKTSSGWPIWRRTPRRPPCP